MAFNIAYCDFAKVHLANHATFTIKDYLPSDLLSFQHIQKSKMIVVELTLWIAINEIYGLCVNCANNMSCVCWKDWKPAFYDLQLTTCECENLDTTIWIYLELEYSL